MRHCKILLRQRQPHLSGRWMDRRTDRLRPSTQRLRHRRPLRRFVPRKFAHRILWPNQLDRHLGPNLERQHPRLHRSPTGRLRKDNFGMDLLEFQNGSGGRMGFLQVDRLSNFPSTAYIEEIPFCLLKRRKNSRWMGDILLIFFFSPMPMALEKGVWILKKDKNLPYNRGGERESWSPRWTNIPPSSPQIVQSPPEVHFITKNAFTKKSCSQNTHQLYYTYVLGPFVSGAERFLYDLFRNSFFFLETIVERRYPCFVLNLRESKMDRISFL